MVQAKCARKFGYLESASKLSFYLITAVCIFTNFFLLLNPLLDSITYLRSYHLIVDVMMLYSGVLMCTFMWLAHGGRFKKLIHGHSIPRSTLFAACVLTLGIVIGYAYFLVFNIAFSNCDQIIDATSIEAQWQEVNDCFLMIVFCVLSIIYVVQRSYFGAIPDNWLDAIIQRSVNVVLTVVWVKIVVFKCPVTKPKYYCVPDVQLTGTQKTWFYLHKGLLNSAIISCASEFFPVLLVAHWLACGHQEERAGELIRKRQEKKSVRRVLQLIAGDITSVYGIEKPCSEWPLLKTKNKTKVLLLVTACTTFFVVIFRWFFGLYYSIRFDTLQLTKMTFDELMEVFAGITQSLFFAAVLKWSLTVEKKRGCPHHRAEARGDMILLSGSVFFITVKLIFQMFENYFQRLDEFIMPEECWFGCLGHIFLLASDWLQFFCLRRIMALNQNDCRESRSFLPFVAICSLTVNWVSFGMTFFETNLIKYQLSKPDYDFSQSTLISMIFTQTIYPADYLFAFTAAGCWTDVLLRFFEMGWFELGPTNKVLCKSKGQSQNVENYHLRVQNRPHSFSLPQPNLVPDRIPV